MAMQVQQNSSFAKRLGARVAQANAEHRDKPVDTGNRRLPAGIRNGVAKVSAMYTKEQTEDNGMTPKGETFFRASAIVMSPQSHDGMKIEGMVTQFIIPLCDIPAKGMRKGSTFSENWYEFQNFFKLLKVLPPNDNDPQKIESYYFAAMRAMCDPKNPPVYIDFSTRGWTPPPSVQQPKPSEMVFETWHGLTTLDKAFDPGAGVVESPVVTQPDRMTPPPSATNHQPPQSATQTERAAAYPPVDGPPPQYQPDNEPLDPADEIAALVEIAMNDPEGATEEGAAASARLEEMAWAAGVTKEQTANAANWAEVADMVLGIRPSTDGIAPEPAALTTPTVGSKWGFAKRDRSGSRLKNGKTNEEFPPQEVEVVTVDTTAETCTVKTIRDGKDVIDIRTKQPVVVKWEWLETIPY